MKRTEGAVCQSGGVQGNNARNSLQRRRDKTPERIIYGESEPSITGGSRDD